MLDSDGTLILNVGKLSGGTAYTVEVAKQKDKPFLVMSLDESPEPQAVIDWVERNKVHVLNVAGPREEGRPGIHDQVVSFLREVL